MNYNELSQTAHAAAKANGWYDQEKSIDDLKTLILSEGFEAFEERTSRQCQ